MINFNEEKVTSQLLEEIAPLLEEHCDELNTLSYKLDVNKMLYIKASATSSIAAYTLREDGVLVGYVAYWISEHPHYGAITAQQDVLFVTKEYRKGRTGISLIKKSEVRLKEDYGVQLVLQSTKKSRDLSNLLGFLGYKEQDKVYCKEI